MRMAAYLVAGAAALAGLRSAEACKCAAPPPPKEALEKSTAVFVGKVVKVESEANGDRMVVLFEVERAWKGVQGKSLIVSTYGAGWECAYRFQQGGTYLVYCHTDKATGLLWTSLCSRTRFAAAAKGDLDALGDGTKIEDKPAK